MVHWKVSPATWLCRVPRGATLQLGQLETAPRGKDGVQSLLPPTLQFASELRAEVEASTLGHEFEAVSLS